MVCLRNKLRVLVRSVSSVMNNYIKRGYSFFLFGGATKYKSAEIFTVKIALTIK